MTVTYADLRERCYENQLRVDRIIHLATMTADDLDTELFEYLQEHQEMIAAVWGTRWMEREVAEDNEKYNRPFGQGLYDQIEEYGCELAHTHADGWLIEASRPVCIPYPSGNYSCSWGNCHVGYFIGITYDEALEKAFVWADEMKRIDRAKKTK